MKIVDFNISRRTLPLSRTFRTSLRTADSIDEVVVTLATDQGIQGQGAACNCAAISGDLNAGITEAITSKIFPAIVGMAVDKIEKITQTIAGCLAHNPGAKAAVDIAVHDLWAQHYRSPLYKLLGGYRRHLVTDLTLSLDHPEQMAEQATQAVSEGFSSLKIKVGANIDEDVQRVAMVRQAAGPEVTLRVDANQAWTPRQAVVAIGRLAAYDVELVEQPVPAWDIAGLQWVATRVDVPIMADESLFDAHDALRLLSCHAVDYLNIKLLKCGGIREALKINAIAEACGVECMLGCMMEGPISLAAAIHLAAAKKNITRIDLDSHLFIASAEPMPGIRCQGPEIFLET